LQRYWLTRVLYGSELRLSKHPKKAREVLEDVQNDPQSMARFLAEKELIHLEEDGGRYGNAYTAWGKFMQKPEIQKGLVATGKTPAEQRRAKALYFECYYHFVYCGFMYGKLGVKGDDKKAQEKREAWYKRTADLIERLEAGKNRDGWELAGPRFLELISTEPHLYEHVPELVKKYKIPKNFPIPK
jgi:hypothetical protein